MNGIITTHENSQSDKVLADCLFDSKEANQDNGGAICTDKQINITLEKNKFLQCSCISDRGSLYIFGARASLFCLIFFRSHTRMKAENIGGNAYSFFDTELRMSDLIVSESWINPECGDGVHHIVRCLSKITRYNISDSIENSCGAACGDFWTPNTDSLVSFANLVNNGGGDAFTTFFGGTFFSERLNIANNTGVLHFFLDSQADYTEFRECCIFRATTHPDLGTCTMIDCFTNFEHTGAMITETTINPFLFSRDCPLGRSHLFTKHENSTLISILMVVILFIVHIVITNAQ